ncbi:MAG: LuxR C-terminal-related transcriptional regulator [Acidimicrobiales bacterium]
MVVEAGREAFERRAWGAAYEHLSGGGELGPEDLERLAIAANLTGHDAECLAAWEQAHEAFLRDGDARGAARCAFWTGFTLLLHGHMAQAGGWLARAERALAEVGECSTSGFLLVPVFLEALGSGQVDQARSLADRIVDMARRCDDPDLLALGLLCQGEAAIAVGQTAAGMRLLDDAMVSVTTGEVSSVPAGIVYCGVIGACVDAYDLRRAAEWTEALTHWCDQQPDLVPFRGQCLVHRSQVLQAHGSWPDAAEAAEEALRYLSPPGHPSVGAALYQLGELHRLRGEHAAAERAYREASRHGREPSPGFELLRLAQGRVGAAVASIQRVVEETRGQRTHPAMLATAVEVLLSAGDGAAARDASDALRLLVTAGQVAPYVQAMDAYCSGSVLLAEGDAMGALVDLRRAGAAWRELGMPYDAARASVQIARACRALSDHDAADRQLESALETFERLGARTDLARAGRLGRSSSGAAGVLTERQCDVLRAVATGKSNREVAAVLGISEHTVARHLQNIFTKLDLPSRAAATSYAHEHGLI